MVDTIDVVANCENVDAANVPAAGLSFKVKRTSLRALASKGLSVAVPCASACTASGALARRAREPSRSSSRSTARPSRAKRMRRATLTVRVTVNGQTAS